MKIAASLAATWALAWISIYLTLWLTVKFSFCRPLANERPQIRRIVISYWSGLYKDMFALFDDVLVEHLRVIGKRDEVEDRRTRNMRIMFFCLSGILLFSSTAAANAEPSVLAPIGTICIVLLGTFSGLQILSLAIVLFHLFYEYRYYKTLEVLKMLATSATKNPDTTAS